mmetsp:Transcript_18488/g.46316  ORF Transcript_18488/g.46316 Transcript_18488/m.46316 type:complete len:211 (+) Transcript_18488:1665-2297(+)
MLMVSSSGLPWTVSSSHRTLHISTAFPERLSICSMDPYSTVVNTMPCDFRRLHKATACSCSSASQNAERSGAQVRRRTVHRSSSISLVRVCRAAARAPHATCERMSAAYVPSVGTPAATSSSNRASTTWSWQVHSSMVFVCACTGSGRPSARISRSSCTAVAHSSSQGALLNASIWRVYLATLSLITRFALEMAIIGSLRDVGLKDMKCA